MLRWLNDAARFARARGLAQGVGLGMAVGAFLLGPDRTQLAHALVLAGGVLLIGVPLVADLLRRRAQRSWWPIVERGSQEIVSGAVSGRSVAARVESRRIVRRAAAYLVGHAEAVAGSSVAVEATALGSGGARRVVALVPPDRGVHQHRRGPLVLVVHPELAEVAVLDPAASAEQLAHISSDPRWDSERLPTTVSINGGWAGLTVALVLGLWTGLAVDWVVRLVAG